MSLSASMHDRFYPGAGGGAGYSYPPGGMYSSVGRVERTPQQGMQYQYGQPAMIYSQPPMYRQEPPAVAVNSFMQQGVPQRLQSREGMMISHEQSRLQSEGEGVIRLNTELTASRVECEALAASLRSNEAGNLGLSDEYRMLRQMMEQKENEYRRLWTAEETRIRNISDETRRNVDNIRSTLIGSLEKMDVTNKNMLECAEALVQLDHEMEALARAGGV